MYRNNNHYNTPRRSNSFQGRGRNEKKLDPSLFVKKAQLPETGDEYVSETNFSDYKIADKLKRNIIDHGYTSPTQIQEKAIPVLLEGRDII